MSIAFWTVLCVLALKNTTYQSKHAVCHLLFLTRLISIMLRLPLVLCLRGHTRVHDADRAGVDLAPFLAPEAVDNLVRYKMGSEELITWPEGGGVLSVGQLSFLVAFNLITCLM